MDVIFIRPKEPPVKAKPPSPPAVPNTPSGDMVPDATSSPKEEPNGVEDSVNGAAAKRPHSPVEEDQAKRHKDTEVRRAGVTLKGFGVGFKAVAVCTLCYFFFFSCRWLQMRT